MANYLMLRDEQFKPQRIIEPLEYSCSVGLSSSSSNDFIFKLPLTEELIPTGFYVTYFGSIYGGIIETQDIDTSTGIVTYHGKSFYGMLDNYLAVWGHSDTVLHLYSELQYPGCQSAVNGGVEPWQNYPLNSPFGYTNITLQDQHLPFTIEFNEPLDISESEVYDITLPAGTTLGGLIEIACSEMLEQKMICRLVLSEFSIIKIQFGKSNKFEQNVSYTDSPVIITDTKKPSAIISGTKMHFINSAGKYQSKSVYAVTDADLMYSGAAQYQIWNSNDESDEKNRQFLKSMREDNSKRISTTITKVLSTEEPDDASVGDYLKIIYKNIIKEGKICEKIFNFKGEIAKVQYVLG